MGRSNALECLLYHIRLWLSVGGAKHDCTCKQKVNKATHGYDLGVANMSSLSLRDIAAVRVLNHSNNTVGSFIICAMNHVTCLGCLSVYFFLRQTPHLINWAWASTISLCFPVCISSNAFSSLLRNSRLCNATLTFYLGNACLCANAYTRQLVRHHTDAFVWPMVWQLVSIIAVMTYWASVMWLLCKHGNISARLRQ